MIPQLQQFLRGFGAGPMPTEAAPDAEGFGALMDQTSAPLEDAEAALIMAAMLAPMLPVQSLPKAGPQESPPDQIATPLLPDFAPIPTPSNPGSVTSGLPKAGVTPLPPENPAEVQDAALRTEPLLPQRMPVTTDQTAGPADPNATLVLDQGQSVPPLPKAKAMTVKESAFLARIEPELDTAVPTVPQAIGAAAIVVLPAATAAPRPVRPLLAATIPIEVDLPDSSPAPFALPDTGSPVAALLADAMALPLFEATEDPGKPVTLEPPPVTFSAPDRPTLVAPVVGPGMPASVLPALLAHAPQAALGPVEVVLNPEELGKIRFEIHHQGDQVKVILAVERPETLDLLRRHAEQLVQEFRAAGYAGASLSFGQWGQQQGGSPRKSDPAAPDYSGPEVPPPPLASANLAPAQGLNLRL